MILWLQKFDQFGITGGRVICAGLIFIDNKLCYNWPSIYWFFREIFAIYETILQAWG